MVKEQKTYIFDRAAAFKALGDPTRLRIFEFLRSCCGPVAVEDSGAVRPIDGPTVGEVCCTVTGAEQITSTVSRHLRELKLAGLITIERRGKNMICGVNHTAIVELADYFKHSSLPDTTEETGGARCATTTCLVRAPESKGQ